MSDEADLLTMFLVCAMLVFSYQYVLDEVQDIATADPTHTGKAFLATIMPWLWLMFIVLSLVVALLIAMKKLS